MSIARNLKDLHGDDIDGMVKEACGICIMLDCDYYEGIHVMWFEDQSAMSFARNWSVATAHDWK